MQPPFPFSAIVGQDLLKRALLMGIIQPHLGGVLIRGTKGVAKSTAVRALASLLPPIETVMGCPFHRRPEEEIPDWPMPEDARSVVQPVTLVELPLGSTEDRVLGTLHWEKALHGERRLEPGLLAAANRGILYIDEVNLLPDHLVDILLDTAASGRHRLERDGLSLSHPARFLLVGTMNPEEGDLRPQLLDRFGIVVDVVDLAEPAMRAEAVRRRLAYESDPASFVKEWEAADVAEAGRIREAQQMLPSVIISAELVEQAAQRCVAEGVEGLRADLVCCRAAAGWAAYQGRLEVEESDLEAVAELALAHRRQTPPDPPPDGSRNTSNQTPHQSPGSAPAHSKESTSHVNAAKGVPTSLAGPVVLPSAGLFTSRRQPPVKVARRSNISGRRRTGLIRGRAVPSHSTRHSPNDERIDWPATLRAAALQQVQRGRTGNATLIRFHADDLRYRARRSPTGCLIIFVIDTSGSMAAWRRMRVTKSAILALLDQAHRHRDWIGVLGFRGGGAETILHPTRNIALAREVVEALPVGGATPLAHGLEAARRCIKRTMRQRTGLSVWTVLLTDGRSNVPLATKDPWQDALHQARMLARCPTECLVIDTEAGWLRLGQAALLARELRADHVPVEAVLGRLQRRSVG